MSIRLEDPAFIPILEKSGVVTMLTEIAKYNPNEDEIKYELRKFCSNKNLSYAGFTTPQMERLLADLVNAKKLRPSIYGGSNVGGETRHEALLGGFSGESFFATISGLERPFEVWMFLNNQLKIVNSIPEDNSSLTTGTNKTLLGAKTGDVVTWSLVKNGIVGWMGSAAVP